MKPKSYGDFDALCSLPRRRGRAFDLCVCPCGWVGKHQELISPNWRGDMDRQKMRRPDGFCPTCRKRPFWMPLSESQAAVLAP